MGKFQEKIGDMFMLIAQALTPISCIRLITKVNDGTNNKNDKRRSIGCSFKEFLKLIGNKNVMLERSPLTNAVNSKNLAAFKHTGFWFCMDTLRDKIEIDEMVKNKKSPWLK